jgi:hypothetical protein
MDVAAVLPHGLRLTLLAFVAAVASYLLLSSFAFAPVPQRAPVVRPPRSTPVVHLRAPPPVPARVTRGGANR